MSEKRALTRKQKEEEAKKKQTQEQTLALQHEVFFQMTRIPQFVDWFEKNIRISHDIDQDNQTIQVKVHYIGDEPKTAPDQNVVRCPGCGVKFDANIEAKLVALATEIPPEAKPPGK